MSLRLKTFNEILNAMANWVSGKNSSLSNFRVGSVVRSLLEAVAVEIESLYFKMNTGFVKTSENAIYSSFDFDRLPATHATGIVSVVLRPDIKDDIFIPKGFKFSTSNANTNYLTFETISDTKIVVGTEVGELRVQCTQSGIVGNVSPNTICRMVSPSPLILKVFNESSLSGGSPEESSEERKKRFTRYITTLSRGTSGALQYGCLVVPGVTGVYVEESIGEVILYVHDSSGNLSEELKTQITQSLENYRSAGVGVVIRPVERLPVDIEITVTIGVGFNPEFYVALVNTALTSFMNGLTVSKPLNKADIIKTVMNVDSDAVTNVLLNIENDIIATKFQLIRPNNITVNYVMGG